MRLCRVSCRFAARIRYVTDSWVGLADAVKGIRAELDAAMAEGVGDNVGLRLALSS